MKKLTLLFCFLLSFWMVRADADITVCVDLGCLPSATAPSVFGGFNGWCANCNLLSDPDGDDIWCTTVTMPNGDNEYKFFIQEGEEMFTPGDPCTVTNFGFTNRYIFVEDGINQTVSFGWMSCDATCIAPAASADITLCVDMSCLPSVTAPSVYGSFNGWCAACNPVTDPDGDGIYCATVNMPGGDNEYKFFRQEGEEMFAPGEPCTVTNFGFTNRFINVTGTPQTLNFGWNSCDAVCNAPATSADITFCVDLSCLPSATAPSVYGGFNGWCANCNLLSDPDGDGIWCTTVVNMPGGDQEYKFFIQEGEEQFAPGEPCTVTNFGFTNRVIDVTGVNETVTFGWNSCDANCVAPAIGQNPTVAAPDPTCTFAQQVISLFSNAYNNVPVNTFLTPWSAATLTDVQIAGNDTKLYENVNFLGIETTGPNLIDASDMFAFSIDVWIDNATTFRVKLVDFGPDQAFGGGDDTEDEITFDNPPQEQWVTYYLPLANFINLQNTDNIAQIILSSNPPGQGRFFVDNMYFTTCSAPGTAAVPTMGEWAMFLFALIMLTMGIVFIKGMQTETGMVTAQGAVPVRSRRFPFNKANYFKAMKHALGLAVVGFAAIYLIWGEIVPADIFGMGFSVLVVSYLIHLFFKE
ncbi:MAG: hypothetical protein AAFZ15_28155 [Bacteroidota bacterium]